MFSMQGMRRNCSGLWAAFSGTLQKSSYFTIFSEEISLISMILTLLIAFQQVRVIVWRFIDSYRIGQDKQSYWQSLPTLLHQQSMLTRSQIKVPLYLLLSLSAVSLLAITAAIILSALWKYIGFMMQTGTASLCYEYLTFKVETLNTYVHNNVFYCACVADVLVIVIVGILVRMVVTFRGGQEENFPEFSRNSFYLLYILYSCGIILVIPGTGYFLTLIIEKGKCLSTIKTEQLLLAMLYLLGLLLLLICWIILFFLYLKYSHYEEKYQTAPPTIAKEQIDEVSMKNYLEMFLLKQRMENMSTILESRRPLLVEEVDQEDKASRQQGQKQKITFVNFEQYKEKQRLMRQKEEEQQKQLAVLMKEQEKKMKELHRQKQEEERMKKANLKQKVSSMALSPDHEDFDKIFEESQEDQPVQEITLNIQDKNLEESRNEYSRQIHNDRDKDRQQSSQSDDPKMKDFYPANYVPVDEQDEQRFKKYKEKLLKRLNRTAIKTAPKKHLQNIQGGRSKKQLQRYISAFKRPKRDEEIYKRKYIEESPEHLETSVIRQSELTDNFSQKQSATFNYHNSPKEEKLESPAIDVIKPLNIDERPQQEQEERVYQAITIRERTKSPMRKKLFQEENYYLQSMNSGSILGALVKKVIEPGHKRRLNQIKQQRQIDSKGPKKRKNEKLIDFIRAKGS